MFVPQPYAIAKYREHRKRLDVRKGVIELFTYLERLGYLSCPASHSHHNSCEGGLLDHSICVTDVLLALRRAVWNDLDLANKGNLSVDSCIFVGLVHDVGKLGVPGRPYYIKDAKAASGYDYNNNNHPPVYMEHSQRSLLIVSHFVDLAAWEAQAIVGHDGQYISANIGMRNRETPLTLLLHFADMWSASQIEQTYSIPNSDIFQFQEEF